MIFNEQNKYEYLDDACQVEGLGAGAAGGATVWALLSGLGDAADIGSTLLLRPTTKGLW